MCTRPLLLLYLIILPSCTHIGRQSAATFPDEQSVDLGGPRTRGTRPYTFETDYLTYAPDGTLLSREQTVLTLMLEVDEAGRQTLVAEKFELIDKDGARTSIPALEGWRNELDMESAELLGVPRSDFQDLQTNEGEPLAPEIAHRVYNTFIDFYTFNNVFARPAANEGNDVSDLTSIGQLIEHYSAYSKPSTGFGDAAGEGSYFENGRVTLKWKGMSRVGSTACALVGFDSGESHFRMKLEPAPGVELTVNGGSQYWGDLHIDAASLWLEEADFIEVVMAQVAFGNNPPTSSVIKRIGRIAALN